MPAPRPYPKEATIVEGALALALRHRARKCYMRKTHGNAYTRSWPDLVGVINTVPVMLEAKTVKGQATPRQLQELRKWHETGAYTAIIRSVDDAEHIITALINNQPPPPVNTDTFELER